MAIKTTAYPEDVFAGKILYKLRVCSGTSQDELGKQVGVTFQQIQKYERGENQMSVRRISQFSNIFKISPLEFFHAKENITFNMEDVSRQGFTLVRLFNRIPELHNRKIVLNLAGSLAKPDNNGEAS